MKEMKTMKKIVYVFGVSAIILLSACSDFLDLEMKSEYSSENYYKTEESAVMAVTGVYNSLYGIKWWVFGDVASDDAVKGGNAGDQADMNAIDDFSATSDNGILTVFWQDTYESVSQANNVITYVAPMNINAALRDRLVGEAKFIRAFSYFNLVNIFGKVPYKTAPQITAEAIHVGLSEINDSYAQIEKDLTDALAVLPPAYTIEKGRITQGAAYALLAKTYLYQEKYTECLAQIANLESLQLYKLLDRYEDLFQTGAEDSLEVIFGLRFINTTDASLGNEFNVWMAPSPEGGYYFNAPTQSYVDCFDEKTLDGNDDPRLDASIGRDGKPWFNGTTFSASWSESTGYLVKKYNEDAVAGLAKSQSTVPYHYIRYADVLLMKAEAINELGGADALAKAASELDKVRTRAGLAATTANTQSTLRKAIRDERRKELGFECHRFFDLMRWEKNRFYFPVPQIEIDANQAIN